MRVGGGVVRGGGIKEKVLAARRAGVKTVILPGRNEKNLVEDVPQEAREGMTFHLVDSVDQVLALALESAQVPAEPAHTGLLASSN